MLGGLNLCWNIIESFNQCGRHSLPIPHGVKLEIYRFLCLIPLRRMSFRLSMNPTVTRSDALQKGGGVCVATGLTKFGEQVAIGGTPWGMRDCRGGRVLSVGLFDGIGCLRVALGLLGYEVAGHISIERTLQQGAWSSITSRGRSITLILHRWRRRTWRSGQWHMVRWNWYYWLAPDLRAKECRG